MREKSTGMSKKKKSSKDGNEMGNTNLTKTKIKRHKMTKRKQKWHKKHNMPQKSDKKEVFLDP